MEEQTITVEEQKLHDDMEHDAMVLTINELGAELESFRARCNALEVERDKLREALASVTRELDEVLNVTSRAISQCHANFRSRVGPSSKAIAEARAALAEGESPEGN